MKLRIKGSSIRLRTVRPEVAQLVNAGRVEETLRFAPGDDAMLTYALVTDTAATEFEVRYQPHEITVVVPAGLARRWASSDEVGMYCEIDLGSAGSLELSIEKDFACLDRSDADNKDTFPHPQLGVVP
jgi:hypothetical protein